MLDVRALKAEMVRNDYTQSKMAAELGISTRTLYNKLNSGEFGNKEMEIMIDKLKLKDPMSIFFAKEVT